MYRVATAMDPDRVHAAMRTRLAVGTLPDAIFAASDVAAMSVLRAVSEAGLDVPREVAVIGYDDVTLAAHTSPPLTTIRQDLARGAALMVDRLLARVAGEPAEHAVIAPALVVRAST